MRPISCDGGEEEMPKNSLEEGRLKSMWKGLDVASCSDGRFNVQSKAGDGM